MKIELELIFITIAIYAFVAGVIAGYLVKTLLG